MKRKKALAYFTTEWKAMMKWLKSYLKKDEPEELHQFRVEVKKLRAFVTMIDHTGDHPISASRLRPVRKIFRLAGNLRNRYVTGQLTNRPPSHPSDPEFHSKINKYRRSVKAAYKALKKKITASRPKTVRHFFDRRLREIAEMLSDRPTEEALHICRKKIKVLLYNEQLARGALKIRINTAYLDQVQEAIGNWHDQRIAAAVPGQNQAESDASDQRVRELKTLVDTLANDFYRRTIAGDITIRNPENYK